MKGTKSNHTESELNGQLMNQNQTESGILFIVLEVTLSAFILNLKEEGGNKIGKCQKQDVNADSSGKHHHAAGPNMCNNHQATSLKEQNVFIDHFCNTNSISFPCHLLYINHLVKGQRV